MAVISIIIRHYNRAASIGECLKSAFLLRPPNDESGKPVRLEVLVADDGSSLVQKRKLKQILAGYPQAKSLFLHHNGPIKTLNEAILSCSGGWYFILDCDDRIPSQALSQLWSPGYTYAYGDYMEIMPDGTKHLIRTRKNIFNTLAGGILFDKSAIIRAGLYNHELFFPEYDLLLRLGIEKSRHLSKIVYYYHRSKDSLTGSAKRVLQGKQQLYKRYGRVLPIRDYDFMKTASPKVKIRAALKSDRELILAWRAHPLIFKYFRQQTKPIDWEEHANFWKNRKHRKDFMIIVQNSGDVHRIGTINFSKLDTDAPEVGILVGELGAHGKGIGSAALELGLKWLQRHGYKKAKANINHANVASIKLFMSQGFFQNEDQSHGEWLKYEKHL